jgi:hypothetical protein
VYTEETASPGLWKSVLVGILGLLVCVSAFIVPPVPTIVYHNWFVGFVATITAIMMTGNRKWERPLATAAAVWLFISGFVPSVLEGTALLVNQISVGVVLIVAAISANIHLRDDIRHARPLRM